MLTSGKHLQQKVLSIEQNEGELVQSTFFYMDIYICLDSQNHLQQPEEAALLSTHYFRRWTRAASFYLISRTEHFSECDHAFDETKSAGQCRVFTVLHRSPSFPVFAFTTGFLCKLSVHSTTKFSPGPKPLACPKETKIREEKPWVSIMLRAAKPNFARSLAFAFEFGTRLQPNEMRSRFCLTLHDRSEARTTSSFVCLFYWTRYHTDVEQMLKKNRKNICQNGDWKLEN